MLIYHYTSLDTLSKILANRTLRFTNMDNLNDKSEYRYGVELLKNKILEYETNFGVRNPFDVDLLDRFMFAGELFSISFTEGSDDLYFWNSHYVPANYGVSIGFEIEEIFGPELIVNKCIYGDPYGKMGRDRYHWFRNLFLYPLAISKNLEFIHITYQTGYIKHPAFSLEKEWRTITFPLKETCVFNSVRGECLYFDYPFNVQAIKEIVVGPSVNLHKNIDRVKCLINQYKLNCTIRSSCIPVAL